MARDDGAIGGVPKRAIRPLAVSVEAALLGIVAMLAANRVGGETDVWLLWLGWAAFATSAGATLVFAARSGRLDGGSASSTAADPTVLDQTAERREPGRVIPGA